MEIIYCKDVKIISIINSFTAIAGKETKKPGYDGKPTITYDMTLEDFEKALKNVKVFDTFEEYVK